MFAKPAPGRGGGRQGGGGSGRNSGVGGLAPAGAVGAGLGRTRACRDRGRGRDRGRDGRWPKGAGDTVGALVERAGQLTDLSEKTGPLHGRPAEAGLRRRPGGGEPGGFGGRGAEAAADARGGRAGSVKARQAFTDIGVSWEELRGLAPEEQFARVAQALGTIPDQERMVAAGADLMGKGFAEIIPLVKHAHEVMEAPVALDAT